MRRNLLLVALLLIGAAVVVTAAFTVGDDNAAAAVEPSSTIASTPGTPSIVPGPDGTDLVEGPVTLPNDIAQVVGAWSTNWDRRTIDLNQLKVGIGANDPRDLIRPLDSPPYETVQEASEWLVDSEWNLFGQAIDGPLEGTQLETALHQNEFWFAWAGFNEGAPVHGA